MWTGSVESIHIASAAKEPVSDLDQASLTPGVGIEGDRYALKVGTFYKPQPDFELTLIEAEAIEALYRDYKIEMPAGEARRNIVTWLGKSSQSALSAFAEFACANLASIFRGSRANSSSKACGIAGDCGRRF